jgi:hypothetical protein
MDNPNLARSVPDVNPPMNYQEHRFESVNNKPDGIVNTLRRSLRKNKEKFYNKRSTTMKSCNSLNHYEQSNHLQRQTSMTPNLICRHQYQDNQTNSPTKNNSLNEESEKNDRMRKKLLFFFLFVYQGSLFVFFFDIKQQLILKNNKSTLSIL